MHKSRNTGTGNRMRETQGMGGMLPNIPGNVLKHFGECREIFRGMSSNIPGNVLKYSEECCQTLREISPIFDVNLKEDNYWVVSDVESCQISTMDLFCENSQRS